MPDQQELEKAQAEYHTAVESAQASLNEIGACLHDLIRGVFTTAKQNVAAPVVPNASPSHVEAPIVEPIQTATVCQDMKPTVSSVEETPVVAVSTSLDVSSPNEHVAAPEAASVEAAPQNEAVATDGTDTGSVVSAEPTAN